MAQASPGVGAQVAQVPAAPQGPHRHTAQEKAASSLLLICHVDPVEVHSSRHWAHSGRGAVNAITSRTFRLDEMFTPLPS